MTLRCCSLGGLAVLMTLVVGVARAQEARRNTIKLCADFTIFPDNHKFPTNPFTLAAYEFNNLGTRPLFVNASGGGKGLQFTKQGMLVTLPAPVSAVDMSVGTFAGDVKIEALDLTGGSLNTTTVQGMNKFQPVVVKAPAGKKVKSLKFTEGGNEGSLATICIHVVVAE